MVREIGDTVKRFPFSGLAVVVEALLVWTLSFAGAASAQQPSGRGMQSGAQAIPVRGNPSTASTIEQPTRAASDRPPALADFAWLEGRWRGEWGSRVAEQTWLGPKAGEMTGIFRLVEGDKILVLELFTLVEKPEAIAFYFRHFTAELLPWEKADATLLKLESVDPQKSVFVNPVNGEPKRTILIRVDADTYTARSEIEPEHGDPKAIEITYRRQKPVEPASSVGSAAHRKKP
jgi:hypothetical protein